MRVARWSDWRIGAARERSSITSRRPSSRSWPASCLHKRWTVVTYRPRGRPMLTPQARLSLNRGEPSRSLPSASLQWGTASGSHLCRAACPSSLPDTEAGRAQPIRGATEHSPRRNRLGGSGQTSTPHDVMVPRRSRRSARARPRRGRRDGSTPRRPRPGNRPRPAPAARSSRR